MTEPHPALLVILSIVGLLVLYYLFFSEDRMFKKID